MGVGYIHLTCKSSFSLLEGMVPVKKLAKAVAGAGFPAVGVAELGNLFSAVEASKHLAGAGVQPILGCELPVLELPSTTLTARPALGMLTLLVQNETGWKNLARLVSMANLRKQNEGDSGVAFNEVLARAEGLICLTGAYGRGWAALGEKQGRLEAFIQPLAEAFGDRLYIQLERHGTDGEAAMEASLLALAGKLDLPLVATNDVRFLKPADQEAFEVLVGIGDSTTMDDPARRRFTPNHHVRSEADMLAAFADIPEACANTVHIAKRCAFLLPAVSVKKMFMPKWEFSGDTPTDQVIREEAAKGLAERLETHVYPRCDNDEARAAAKAQYEKQLAFELDVIIGMGYEGYFLITSDFIRWAKSKGIPVGPGRGSGAGSLVAWSLKITDLDPLRWELYFERFLNPDRVSLPDFDIDFCQDRREEVIAYVQTRFGAERVAQIITFGTLKAKACLRDVGRVLGLGYNFVGQIAALVPEGAKPPPISEVLETDERLKARYEDEEDVKRLIDVALQLEGCYRHASTHAAGVIITDRPIAEVCGLYVDPRSPMPATQFSMGDAEYAGLVKFDFLGLKTLSVVRMAEVLARKKQPEFDINTIPLDDMPSYHLLELGRNLGVFQIESAGMVDLTKRMKVSNMEDLSALIALYRPGPMEWIPSYIARKMGQEPVSYPHPLLEDTLKVTFGIAVYQEQVMQMARTLAGYTLAGADMLRRAMGKKKPEEMAKQREMFVKGAADTNGIAADVANSIFDQMSAFAGYGFNKAHSMAYALIAYQTAYLKAHFPLEFMAATMTYDRGNTDKLLKYKMELEKLGFTLLPPDVNASEVMFSVEEPAGGQGAVRHALAAIKGAGEEVMRGLVAERQAGGPFSSIWNLLARLDPQGMNKRQLEVLIKSGALDSLEPNRALLLANMDKYLAYAQANAEQKSSGQESLFSAESGDLDPAPFMQGLAPALDIDHLQQLAFEQETVGFYLSDHPLSAFAEELDKVAGLKPLAEMEDFAAAGGGNCKVAGIVHDIREVKTKSGNRMGILSLSDASGQTEVAVFSEAYANHQGLLESGEPLMLNLRVQQDGERLRINAEEIRTLANALGTRAELSITLPDATLLPQIKTVLDKAGQGPTRVRLTLPAADGKQATLKIPHGIACNPNVLTNLRGLGVAVT
ncbi:MAG: DNA polymerase III subunit alpha [Pseudomonadaceae bacterium]|nr:DNA polymerase III subunit alpha [Pseudomonadaceae bacterium]